MPPDADTKRSGSAKRRWVARVVVMIGVGLLLSLARSGSASAAEPAQPGLLGGLVGDGGALAPVLSLVAPDPAVPSLVTPVAPAAVIVDPLLAPIAPVAQPVLDEVTAPLAPIAQAAASTVAPVVQPLVATIVDPLAGAVVPLVSPVLGSVAPVVEDVAPLLEVLSPVTREVATTLDTLAPLNELTTPLTSLVARIDAAMTAIDQALAIDGPGPLLAGAGSAASALLATASPSVGLRVTAALVAGALDMASPFGGPLLPAVPMAATLIIAAGCATSGGSAKGSTDRTLAVPGFAGACGEPPSSLLSRPGMFDLFVRSLHEPQVAPD